MALSSICNIGRLRAACQALRCPAAQAWACFIRRVAEVGYWSPVGFKESFFACDVDTMSNDQCLSGTPDQNESLAVVNLCADVRASPP